jgi:hypothetical protein
VNDGTPGEVLSFSVAQMADVSAKIITLPMRNSFNLFDNVGLVKIVQVRSAMPCDAISCCAFT